MENKNVSEENKRKSTINGVIVLPNDEKGMNIEHWIEKTRNEYEAPDQHGKTKTVEFATTKTDTEHYVNYWVY
mgnify:CR=1 FL=1|tara:strand:+ start:112 stop:330 length:219 start_codon:yes stop_codon:yes gene_type:complete